MFNAHEGREASMTKIEAASNQLACDIDDFIADPSISRTEKEALLENLATVVAGRESARSFANGTYAQNSAGQPARALGAGSPAGNNPTSEQEALGFLLNSGSLPTGVKAALRRLLNPSDPDQIRVGVDGTPVEVGQLRQEVATKTADLASERDPAKPGSLASKLAASAKQNGSGHPDPTPFKKAIQAALRPAFEALGHSTGAMGGGSKLSRQDFDAVKHGIDDALRLVS